MVNGSGPIGRTCRIQSILKPTSFSAGTSAVCLPTIRANGSRISRKHSFLWLTTWGISALKKPRVVNVGIFKVRRRQTGAAWSIDPLIEIHSSWQNEGEHFHVAGWTPNGVVVAIGDGIQSRVALLQCDDWSNYTDLSNWTVIPRWQGVLEDGVSQAVCNQFWGCCPSNQPNRLLCGADNVAGGILGLNVPADSSASPIFEGLIGVQPGALTRGLSGNTVSWLHRTAPETEGPIVARQVFDPFGPQRVHPGTSQS